MLNKAVETSPAMCVYVIPASDHLLSSFALPLLLDLHIQSDFAQ